MNWIRRAPGLPAVALGVSVALLAAACGGGDGPPGGGRDPGESPPPPPAECPLTGLKPESGTVPNRPALAVKVENLPSVRPQTGLSHADLIFEQPVEAGITRFVVVYQCKDAEKIMPIRSARFTDAAILAQFGRPIFAYAGAVPQIVQRLRQTGAVDVNFNTHGRAYHRDPAREAPHDLYSSTQELYGLVRKHSGTPAPLFTYSTSTPKGKKTRTVHLPFSTYSDVYWSWDPDRGEWLRSHGDVPHTYSDGTQVGAENVVIQVVKIVQSEVTDVQGVPSPEVVALGGGKAYVLRNGRMITGRWRRDSLDEATRFLTAGGDEVALHPGNTWVELLPDDKAVERS